MKKHVLYLSMSLTIVFMSACSHDTQSNEANDARYDKLNDVQSIKDVTIKIPENIFDSQKKNENINEDEMKQSIKNYLDYSWELSENIVPLSSTISDENATESDREKLQKLMDLAKKNDTNFHDFISNNNIPDDYQKPSKEIYEYVSSTTALLLEMQQEIDKLSQNGNLLKTDFSFTKRFTKVNGRKQKEIEKFLNEKNIKTTYFNQQ
ncbi:NDxxF motif lipoprotein [Bacillus multifaciens]|uniref:NDxxF motif lipoprotein n=1 Tax=Bacillus multifaciens TaxID=3068506 RepID=UPI0027429285|nr:NDxxF motif lipoprotein [Bacillus sp. WLY-B-L8]MDP7977660.1 NDxxF motif lipoprotein [Bacillus sp. WLY-B-L8]